MSAAIDLTNPIFHDEEKARAWLEETRWGSEPTCGHCGSVNVHRMEGQSHRAGLLYCRDCRLSFSVTVGSVMERSHVPLHKWVLAFHLMAASKKGMSAHQLHPMLKVTYKTAWFMAHRIREAMTDAKPGSLGGEGKIVEADEMYVGKREIPTLARVVGIVRLPRAVKPALARSALLSVSSSAAVRLVWCICRSALPPRTCAKSW